MKTSSLKKYAVLLLVLIVPTLIWAEGAREMETEEIPDSQAKYVFLFIGDGMGLPQINAAEAYISTRNNKPNASVKLNFSDFPAQGLTTTYANDRFITGSAAAATAMATGKKTNIGVLSMDPSAKDEYETIAEQASARGMKVGIISSVSLDHATPAAFYSHQPSRNNYYEIGLEAADSKVDYFAGGHFRLGKAPKDKPDMHEIFASKGWHMISTKAELNAIPAGTDKVYAHNNGFAGDALPYEIDRAAIDSTIKNEYTKISLAEFTAKGIELLDNDKGFFMMVEGGKIDWACHANDASSAIQDTIAFADAVDEAIAFYNEHPAETLIIVTGDHECGGLTIGFAGTEYESAFNKIAGQKVSFEYFDEYVLADYLKAGNTSIDGLLPQIKEYFGLSDFSEYESSMLAKAFTQTVAGEEVQANDEETYLLYGGYTPLTMQLTHTVANRAGLSWTSYQHTGIPVPTFALGAGAELFNGYYDNTDIYKKTAAAMGIPTTATTAMAR